MTTTIRAELVRDASGLRVIDAETGGVLFGPTWTFSDVGTFLRENPHIHVDRSV